MADIISIRRDSGRVMIVAKTNKYTRLKEIKFTNREFLGIASFMFVENIAGTIGGEAMTGMSILYGFLMMND